MKGSQMLIMGIADITRAERAADTPQPVSILAVADAQSQQLESYVQERERTVTAAGPGGPTAVGVRDAGPYLRVAGQSAKAGQRLFHLRPTGDAEALAHVIVKRIVGIDWTVVDR